jgi:DNA-binding Lrp family transcriptional regulator
MPRKSNEEILIERGILLKHLALNSELSQTVQDLEQVLNTSLSTTRRRITEMHSEGLIKVEKSYPRKRKSWGQPPHLYELTLKGIIKYLEDSNYEKIDIVAENYKHKLVTFKKWRYFRENGVKDILLTRIKKISDLVMNKNTYNRDEVDGEILLTKHIFDPDNIMDKNITEQVSKDIIKIWDLIDGDYDLVEFRDRYILQEKQRRMKEIENITRWEKKYVKHHSSVADLKTVGLVIHKDLKKFT